ncbi:hypothetical protein ACFWUP_30300 [Nocardia sp. NPDC058658]|uniref:hypothetical protein n=1 Tax=Nocardia sp. NPDC058658 TaxID=3346580 RepID=UPI00365B9E02
MFEGIRDAMIVGSTDPAEVEELRRALDPDTQQATMSRVNPAGYAAMATILAEMPPGGYRAYVREVCAVEKEWVEPLDNSGVRWAMAWDALNVCQLIIGQPVDQRDAYLEAEVKSPTLWGTESEWLIRHGEVKGRAARKHICPQ